MKSSVLKPTKADQRYAKLFLEGFNNENRKFKFEDGDLVSIRLGDNEERILVPKRVFQLWRDIMEYLAAGSGISVLKSDTYISTQLASEILNLSRPSIIKLLENGDIPFKMAGSHRRILLSDVVHYQIRTKESRTFPSDTSGSVSSQINLDY